MQDFSRQIAQEFDGARLTDNGLLCLTVTSQSMSPFICMGDRVLVQAIGQGTIRRGDVLVTQRSDGFLTHRLVAVDESGLHTKGDRNQKPDDPISAQFITGLVVAVERKGRYRNIRTRPRILTARIVGWLGWKEAHSASRLGIWITRLLSRSSLVLTRM